MYNAYLPIVKCLCFSWTRYRFHDQRLAYESSNSKNEFHVGHKYLFRPTRRDLFIGLNKQYETSVDSSWGLCQIYCAVVYARDSPVNTAADSPIAASPIAASRSVSSRSTPGGGSSLSPPPPPPSSG